MYINQVMTDTLMAPAEKPTFQPQPIKDRLNNVEVKNRLTLESGQVTIASDEHPFTNEDAVLHQALGVLDGIGGAKMDEEKDEKKNKSNLDIQTSGAEIASDLGAKTAEIRLLALPTADVTQQEIEARMAEILQETNRVVLKAALERFKKISGREPKTIDDWSKLMGATAAFAHVYESIDGKLLLTTGHVGDSRIRVIRNGQFVHSSLDHTEAYYHIMNDPTLTPEQKKAELKRDQEKRDRVHLLSHPDEIAEAKQPKYRRVLQSLGMPETPQVPGQFTFEPTVDTFELQDGDLIVIETDGTKENTSEDEALRVFTTNANPASMARDYSARALDNSRRYAGPKRLAKGADDMTVKVTRVRFERQAVDDDINQEIPVAAAQPAQREVDRSYDMVKIGNTAYALGEGDPIKRRGIISDITRDKITGEEVIYVSVKDRDQDVYRGIPMTREQLQRLNPDQNPQYDTNIPLAPGSSILRKNLTTGYAEKGWTVVEYDAKEMTVLLSRNTNGREETVTAHLRAEIAPLYPPKVLPEVVDAYDSAALSDALQQYNFIYDSKGKQIPVGEIFARIQDIRYKKADINLLADVPYVRDALMRIMDQEKARSARAAIQEAQAGGNSSNPGTKVETPKRGGSGFLDKIGKLKFWD